MYCTRFIHKKKEYERNFSQLNGSAKDNRKLHLLRESFVQILLQWKEKWVCKGISRLMRGIAERERERGGKKTKKYLHVSDIHDWPFSLPQPRPLCHSSSQVNLGISLSSRTLPHYSFRLLDSLQGIRYFLVCVYRYDAVKWSKPN